MHSILTIKSKKKKKRGVRNKHHLGAKNSHLTPLWCSIYILIVPSDQIHTKACVASKGEVAKEV